MRRSPARGNFLTLDGSKLYVDPSPAPGVDQTAGGSALSDLEIGINDSAAATPNTWVGLAGADVIIAGGGDDSIYSGEVAGNGAATSAGNDSVDGNSATTRSTAPAALTRCSAVRAATTSSRRWRRQINRQTSATTPSRRRRQRQRLRRSEQRHLTGGAGNDSLSGDLGDRHPGWGRGRGQRHLRRRFGNATSLMEPATTR